MSADPAAARGQIPVPPARCECAHLVTLHRRNTAGMKTSCQQCECRVFIAAEVVGRG